ncbi:hypothetical protein KA478_03725 [Patescibacteria group bacterium]|nr:hypothetical protein [Patescibacteria group bacterium]
MISDEFGIPYRPYIPKKEEHIYYYHSDRVSDFLTAMVKKEASQEYEYLYSRNHDTHLLLAAPDEMH